MKIRSKSDKWLLMRKRNKEILHSALSETDVEKASPIVGVYVGVLYVLGIIVLECGWEVLECLLN